MKNSKRLTTLVAAWTLGIGGLPASAQVNVGGEVASTLRNTEISDFSNRTFRNFSNFNSMRARLFVDAQASDDVSVFTQILVDSETYDFQLYGAYARVERIAGPFVNLQVGLIPHPVGAWGERTYQMENPLIGTPLPYSYHSSYVPGRPDSLRTADDLWAVRDTRSIFGMPVIYDACWNTGGEVYGSAGKLDYSAGLLTGSVSKPTVQDAKGSPQGTVHLAYNFSPGLKVGASGFYGAYLFPMIFADSLPAGASLKEYASAGAGYELYFAHRQLEVHSEGFFSYWEHPYVPRLDVLSGYADAKYKFHAGWYVAGRYDWYRPGDVTNASGVTQAWDYPLARYEVGLGYKPKRSVVTKLVTQLNRYPDAEHLDHDLVAFQIVVGY